MQELTAPPQMTSPYTPIGGSFTAPNMPQPPRLGTPIPGSSGGLPAKPGLSVYNNPLAPTLQSNPQNSAQHTQSFGRGQDTMLVHMTPQEVNSLRGLAQQFGGDLTTNPNTGLPEAGLLGKILPTILGVAGMAFGIPPVWMGALGAAGGTAATGSLKKGLMMGLGAFGGASAAGGLGLAGKVSSNAFGLMGNAGSGVLNTVAAAAPAAAAPAAAPAAAAPAAVAAQTPMQMIQHAAATPLTVGAPNIPAPMALTNGINTAGKAGMSGFMQGFGDSARMGLPGGIIGKAAPMAAGLGLLNAVTPTAKQYKEKDKPSEYGYTGPYRVSGDRFISGDTPAPRNDAGILTNPQGRRTSGEQLYFKPTTSFEDAGGNAWTPGEKTTPLIRGTTPKGKTRYVYENDITGGKDHDPSTPYAHGGGVFQMESGGHVFPAKAVAAYGNFDTEAGQRKLAKMGGIPIKGPGDGVSDSIPAMIDGDQRAKVATGEVYFPPRTVKRLGGTKKLYAMMRNAEKAASRAKSGEKVRGLGALG